MGLRRFKKYAIGAAGMLVLVVAIVLATGSGSAVAAQITSVFVTNDASHPVPVNVGNTTLPIHEQGTATVSGTVGLSPTANTVKLDPSNSEVKVGNSTANPVPVHSVDSESSTQTLFAVGTLVPAGQSVSSATAGLDGFSNARVAVSITAPDESVSAGVWFGPYPSNGFTRTSVAAFSPNNNLHIDSPVWGREMFVIVTNNSGSDTHVQGYVYAVK